MASLVLRVGVPKKLSIAHHELPQLVIATAIDCPNNTPEAGGRGSRRHCPIWFTLALFSLSWSLDFVISLAPSLFSLA